MKKLLVSLLIFVLHSVSAADVSFNAGVTSNYVWRGVTQSNDKPAISAGFTYEDDSGLFGDVWASSVDFDTDASFEVDYTLGYYHEVTDLFSWSAGYAHYTYPDENANVDTGEVFGEFYYDNVTLNISRLVYSQSDAFSDNQDNDWWFVSLMQEQTVFTDYTLSYGLEHFSGKSIRDWQGKDYATAFVSLSYQDLTLQISDTSLDNESAIIALSYEHTFDL